jgi:hypothetical protein
MSSRLPIRFAFFAAGMLLLAACASSVDRAAAPAAAAAPIDPSAYTGLWTPDHAANRKLATQMQKQLRQRMAKLRPPGGKAPSGPGGPGGPGGMGGKPPGGMPPGGPPGGMPGMDTDPMAMLSAVGLLRPEMDFASPLQGDLRIVYDPAGIQLGAADGEAVILMFRGGARELGDGGIRAFASRQQGPLVIEIATDAGVRVVHTYRLENGGARLRVNTRMEARDMPMPGGLETERVFDRVVADAGPTP